MSPMLIMYSDTLGRVVNIKFGGTKGHSHFGGRRLTLSDAEGSKNDLDLLFGAAEVGQLYCCTDMLGARPFSF